MSLVLRQTRQASLGSFRRPEPPSARRILMTTSRLAARIIRPTMSESRTVNLEVFDLAALLIFAAYCNFPRFVYLLAGVAPLHSVGLSVLCAARGMQAASFTYL